MRTHDDTGWRDPSVGLATFMVSYFVPIVLGKLFGFGREVDGLTAWFETQETWLYVLCVLAQAAIGFVLIFAAYICVRWALLELLDAARRFSDWVAGLVQGFCDAVRLAFQMMASFYLRLMKLPFRLIGDLTLALNGKVDTWLDEERKLRSAFRSEYSADFKNYAEFRAYFKSVQRGEAPPYPDAEDDYEPEPEPEYEPDYEEAPKADPYLEALRVLGLVEPFTQTRFKAVFRTRMKEAHPDITGSDEAARQLNVASNVIKQRKGWK